MAATGGPPGQLQHQSGGKQQHSPFAAAAYTQGGDPSSSYARRAPPASTLPLPASMAAGGTGHYAHVQPRYERTPLSPSALQVLQLASACCCAATPGSACATC
jgi:hypothetical protein